VANPEWGWWIILYFFCGGIAAGAYFASILIEWTGREEDRVWSRLGYHIAFPLIILCGLFLILDLNRPERFWHMLFQSETVHQALAEGWPRTEDGWKAMLHAAQVKYWSPMSIGAWALSLFGLCAFLSYLGRNRARRGILARLFQLIGAALGFFIASYTGALVSATNQPIWSDTNWIAPLFLTSAASTGMATLILLAAFNPSISEESHQRLQKADLWVLLLESVVFLIFLNSLGTYLVAVCGTWQGLLLVEAVPVVGILTPLALQLFHQSTGRGVGFLAACLSLGGGFLLRYTLLTLAPAILAEGTAELPSVSPDAFLRTLPGSALVVASLLLGILVAVLLSWRLGFGRVTSVGAGLLVVAASLLTLRGALRSSDEIGTPPAAAWIKLSPEDGRARGGGPGASAGNRPSEIVPRSKVFSKQ
jgi:formate-dependent nitrite reductase membrane component NrfD